MRWDDLFADLEAQAELLDQRERAGEVGERARIEIGRVAAIDRIRPSEGALVSVILSGGERLDGILRRVGAGWLLLEEQTGHEAVIALPAVLSVAGLSRRAGDPGSIGVVESRLGLASALRGMARDRAPVRVHLVSGHELDGTIDRVGSDYFELARHARGELRRRSEVHSVQLIFNRAVAVVRRDR